MLQISDLSKIYSTPRGPIAALDGVDLRIERGEFVAVVGPSGSGKSTLLAMIGGLCRPTSGSIQLDGRDIVALSPAAMADFRGDRIGFVFQFASLLPNLRAIDNVALPALIRRTTAYRPAYDRARRMLERVGLGERWDAYPGELSGGEQRRVAIARALVNEPPLLLADEPTSDLDADSEQEVLALLVDLHRTRESTLILVTHNMELTRDADRIVRLEQGRLIADEPNPVWDDHSFGSSSTKTQDWPSFEAPAVATIAATAIPATRLRPEEPNPLGAGLGRFLADFASWSVAVTVGLLAINYGVAALESGRIAAKQEVRRTVEDLALRTLRADLDTIEPQADGSYLLTLYLLNPDLSRSLHVMGPAVQAFVQVDHGWQALQIEPLDERSEKVTHIVGRRQFRYRFRADVDQFDELIKGYMHLRFSNAMIVAESDTPSTDLFDRTDDYYVYLKPDRITDDEVRQANGWTATTLVPRWIPMKAH